MVKPYYQDELVTIYHGDAFNLLPSLPLIDSIIADPPYGISWAGPRMNREAVTGDDVPFDPSSLLALCDKIILWGANNFASRLPDSANWLVWLKRGESCATKDHGDCELAWTRGVVKGGIKVKRFIWDGNIRELDVEMERLHPAQKPIAIMSWCVRLVDSSLILDPFTGSGSTLFAAKRMGVKAIGIEIEERFCEVAAKRMTQLSQRVLNFAGANTKTRSDGEWTD